MIVKLLVLVALAFSLGDSRDVAAVDDTTTSMVSLLESEPELADALVIEHPIANALPRIASVPPITHLAPMDAWDPAGVFRPPRLIA